MLEKSVVVWRLFIEAAVLVLDVEVSG
jgi:hypothetical protein